MSSCCMCFLIHLSGSSCTISLIASMSTWLTAATWQRHLSPWRTDREGPGIGGWRSSTTWSTKWWGHLSRMLRTKKWLGFQIQNLLVPSSWHFSLRSVSTHTTIPWRISSHKLIANYRCFIGDFLFIVDLWVTQI